MGWRTGVSHKVSNVKIAYRPRVVEEAPPPPSTLLTGNLLWLEMNEVANIARADSSPSGFHAADTNLSVAQEPAGRIGAAALFGGGSSDELLIDRTAAPSLFPADADFTIAGWLNLATIQQNCGYVSTSDFTKGYRLWTPPGDNLLRWQVNGTEVTVAPATTTWFHFVAYHDSVGDEIGLIIDDGTPITTAHATGIDADTAILPNFKVGNMGVGAFAPDAAIDGVCAWSRLLTTDEVTEHESGIAYPG